MRENALQLPDDKLLKKLPIVVIRKGYEWLNGIYENEWKEAAKLRSLLSEELWNRRENWDMGAEHAEVRAMRRALNRLRKSAIAQARPELFKVSEVKRMLKDVKP